MDLFGGYVSDQPTREARRRWRFYRTASGNEVVRDEILSFGDDVAATIAAHLDVIAEQGLHLGGARHLRGDVWEARIEYCGMAFRVLFSREGRYSQILLGLHTFDKKTQKTPVQKLELAERRLHDWRSHG